MPILALIAALVFLYWMTRHFLTAMGARYPDLVLGLECLLFALYLLMSTGITLKDPVLS